MGQSADHAPGRAPWQGWATGAELPALAGHTWGIFGLGVTGQAAAQLLTAHGAKLLLVDENPALEGRLAPLWPAARWRCGPVGPDAFAGCDAVLSSAGISPRHPALEAAAARGVPLFGEAELLAKLAPAAPIVAITGTNGKSTTTSLVGALLVGAKRPVFVGGNLGPPISSWLLAGPPDAALSLELSSYMLDAMQSVRPKVGVVLNVTPDHLERYGTFARYAASKARLVASIAKDGIAVLNADDQAVRAMAPLCPGRVWWFGAAAPLPGDGLLVTPEGTVHGQGALAKSWPALSVVHERLIGQHNRLNAAAALLALQAFLAPEAGPTADVLRSFHAFAGLPHRLQLVGALGGVAWLNDSKATNDAAAATAVRAMAGPYVLLLGGVDKGGGYREVALALAQRPAKAIVAFGAAREVIAEALQTAGLPVRCVPTLQAACERAKELTAPGDTVLLSPACASFDAFQNYLARGDWFARWVEAQQKTAASAAGAAATTNATGPIGPASAAGATAAAGPTAAAGATGTTAAASALGTTGTTATAGALGATGATVPALHDG